MLKAAIRIIIAACQPPQESVRKGGFNRFRATVWIISHHLRCPDASPESAAINSGSEDAAFIRVHIGATALLAPKHAKLFIYSYELQMRRAAHAGTSVGERHSNGLRRHTSLIQSAGV